MENYEKGPTLGEGTFGRVFRAKDRRTGRLVAIKKIRMGKAKEGVNVTAIREIKFLKELQHKNVIELIDVFPHKRNLYLVYEYMTSDLEAIIKDKANIRLKLGDIKAYMQAILEGLAACHRYWIMHRDVKPNNILLGPEGQIKLADFGAGRIFGSPNDRKFTTQVFARWYRAPELLFDSQRYSSAVDMWAVGCVFAELMLRRPWLPGNNDLEQLSLIFDALGTPTEEQWPGMKSLPTASQVVFKPIAPPSAASLRQLFRCDADAVDLLQQLLCFDPSRRISAEHALKHPYFKSNPRATKYADLPKPTVPFGEERTAANQGLGEQVEGSKGEGGEYNGDGLGKNFLEGIRRSSFPPAASDQMQRDQTQKESTSGMRMSLPADVKIQENQQTPNILKNGHDDEFGKRDSMELERPQLGSADKAYLRKRKLDMDQAFLEASND
ncbi:CDK activating kinase [Chloropicon primus]|uniref:[RNA-polymerase]-subunit kinase n=1 Tax=Chloropicon primus TaxID=1764295 RepID=A0A5B8MEC4_9CHLO|nr:CDK activating kinase [Chloropicon primus]UPQ96868.1 CDK activating kinase [Chloropicon primus]|eukprot:QDZ17652.1 CDK activating kinase [Chloropicon primus]